MSLTWGVVSVKSHILLFVFFAAIILAVTAANSLKALSARLARLCRKQGDTIGQSRFERVLTSRLLPISMKCLPVNMVPLHFHHGDEFHLVFSGEWAAQVEGRPDHVMNAGDAQYVEREHLARREYNQCHAFRPLAVMIVDNDKPIIEMKH